jgi:hypothetical protein
MGLAGVAVAATAHADGYPKIIVDRPLVLLPDMSAFDIGLDFPTYRFGDSSNTRLGQYSYLDIVVAHAFGPVQTGVRLVDSYSGPFAEADVSAMLGPGEIFASAGLRAPRASSGIDHDYAENIGYGVKALAVPHVLAFHASGSVDAEQYASTDMVHPPVSGHPVAVDAGLDGTLQLVDELALAIGASVSLPLVDTANIHTSPAVGASLTYAVSRFDLYGQISASDLLHTPRPYASAGIVMRFGG